MADISRTKPFISIIVATKNSGRYIDTCLLSIQKQLGASCEVVLIDGASTDDTISRSKNYPELLGAFVSEPDSGIYDAWNKGIALASGEWVMFLGADDSLRNDSTLVTMQQQLDMCPQSILISYGNVEVINSVGKIVALLGAEWATSKNRLLKGHMLPHPATLYRREYFEKHGPFNTDFKIAGDYEMLLRELKSNDAFHFSAPPVVMLEGGVSSRPDLTEKMWREVWSAQQIHGHKVPSLLVIVNILRTRIRNVVWAAFGSTKGKRITSWVSRKIRRTPKGHKS